MGTASGTPSEKNPLRAGPPPRRTPSGSPLEKGEGSETQDLALEMPGYSSGKESPCGTEVPSRTEVPSLRDCLPQSQRDFLCIGNSLAFPMPGLRKEKNSGLCD
jgi:hypothetical protein